MLGDVEITLKMPSGTTSKKFTLSPTWEAVWAIEDQLNGLSIGGLLTTFGIQRQLTGRLLTTVITEGIKASGKESEYEVTADKLAPCVHRTGYTNPDLLKAVITFLKNCCNGGLPEDSELFKTTSPSAEGNAEEITATLGDDGSDSPSSSSSSTKRRSSRLQ